MAMEARVIAAESGGVETVMAEIGRRARKAARLLATAPTEVKNRALARMAVRLREAMPTVLAANREDVEAGRAQGLAASFVDRLLLDEKRVEAIARGIEEIAGLADPVGRTLAEWTRPNGLVIRRVATPLGVIGIVYESRPNVTADAGALALKSGNAAILRGGSDSFRSSAAIVAALRAGLADAGLPEDAIQLVPTRDRAAVGLMLRGLDGNVDVIVPRGGKSLVARVQDEARVPVFAHLEGICHVYVHEDADPEMARAVVVNAKMRRTGICGAAETLLIDRAGAERFVPLLVGALQAAGCAVRGCAETRALAEKAGLAAVAPATEADWSTEYLDAIIAVRVVDSLEAAIDHIETHGSHHTEAVLTADPAVADRFMAGIDSAILLWNASTQFADGGEFGMGAEIGIATGKMHARGPVGVEQLCSFKYRVTGTGQTRP